MTKNLFLFLAIASILIASPLLGSAFADKNDQKDKGNYNGKQDDGRHDKNDNNPFQAIWNAITNLQDQINDLSFIQTDPNKPIMELQVSQDSNAPAILVKDENNVPLFTVHEDGSLQIGSNTVIINPDGTVTGGPLHLESGSTVNGELISTGPHTTDTLSSLSCSEGQVAKMIGGNWICSVDESGSSSGDNLGNHMATQVLDMNNNDIDNANQVTANSFNFASTQTRTVKIGAASFVPQANQTMVVNTSGGSIIVKSNPLLNQAGLSNSAFAGVQSIPDGAKITGFECRILDPSTSHYVGCVLVGHSDTTTGTIADAWTTLADSSNTFQVLTGTVYSPHVYDSSTEALSIQYTAYPSGCESCQLAYAKITFETDKAN